tara:strand:- start:239 stop:481 length:243 start_codon:yes stop_codon:yes gene_type:complete
MSASINQIDRSIRLDPKEGFIALLLEVKQEGFDVFFRVDIPEEGEPFLGEIIRGLLFRIGYSSANEFTVTHDGAEIDVEI